MFPRCCLICSGGLAGRAAAGADAAPAKNTLERGAGDVSGAAKGISQALRHAGPPATPDRGSRCLLRVTGCCWGVHPLALGDAQHISAPLSHTLEISLEKTAQRAGIHPKRGWDQHSISWSLISGVWGLFRAPCRQAAQPKESKPHGWNTQPSRLHQPQVCLAVPVPSDKMLVSSKKPRDFSYCWDAGWALGGHTQSLPCATSSIHPAQGIFLVLREFSWHEVQHFLTTSPTPAPAPALLAPGEGSCVPALLHSRVPSWQQGQQGPR